MSLNIDLPKWLSSRTRCGSTSRRHDGRHLLNLHGPGGYFAVGDDAFHAH
jgi:hypothetical protein